MRVRFGSRFCYARAFCPDAARKLNKADRPLGSIELRLQNLSSGPDSNGRQEDTVIKGTVSRIGKPEYIYFIATLRASSIVSLDLFETATRDGYVSGSVRMVPLQSTGTSLVPLLFLSCYVSDMLDGRGLCR